MLARLGSFYPFLALMETHRNSLWGFFLLSFFCMKRIYSIFEPAHCFIAQYYAATRTSRFMSAGLAPLVETCVAHAIHRFCCVELSCDSSLCCGPQNWDCQLKTCIIERCWAGAEGAVVSACFTLGTGVSGGGGRGYQGDPRLPVRWGLLPFSWSAVPIHSEFCFGSICY